MDCRSCGVANAAERRYCCECGERLGAACTVCFFFNTPDDKYCGGCGRRLAAREPGVAGSEPVYAPLLGQAGGLGGGEGAAAAPAGGAEAGEEGVSQSEIDGLFENILDEEPGEGEE